MKNITKEELDRVLENHKLWLDTKGKEGKRADLSFTDLRKFTFSKKNLSYVNLEGACLVNSWLYETKLCFTNLKNSNLSGSNLEYTDLRGSNLSNSILRNVFFKGTNLKCAIFSDADLSFSTFKDVDMQFSNLTNSNLYFVKLLFVNLFGANLEGANNTKVSIHKPNVNPYALNDEQYIENMCSGDFKIDNKTAKQIAYNLVDLMKKSDLEIPDNIVKYANESHVVDEYDLPKL